ncbi:CHAT domain-containing protein [Oscillatoria salina]|uniref:CHAT domain-containing protein n=1 Tax=Oscillatoria salina TaxID=331517 RepID=UPI0013BBAABA|nr:CHAT domain-containing protein [Oscillatoria salina]MBZ8181068.1 CHAT domain-containing protein [Oscillatoria salina IIICB1]NET91183.1 CHAT domain-containing protein [Kamptonema sp. SIO1D9]
MSVAANPCLSIAIARLRTGQENFAIWVLQAPLPGGYVHHDCIWSSSLTQKWLRWQEMFSLRELPHVPFANHPTQSIPLDGSFAGAPGGYGGRLMQDLGINLWQWLFEEPIRSSLAQSQGIAIGQNKPLRLRLEIRDPNLIPLPWEIMQPEAGKQAISLNQQILFSRTTSDVDPFLPPHSQEVLNILLVLGNNLEEAGMSASMSNLPRSYLELQKEAAALVKVIERSKGDNLFGTNEFAYSVPVRVDTLVQPTPAELIDALEFNNYNILFYSGHGITAPDGGLLFLRPDATINGTELAQVLVRTQVTLAVFNACWGAGPDRQGQHAIKRSSLAEVLIHHGVPAVLGMREEIADREALSFIETLTEALSQRMSIDMAVTLARQQLLTLYKFNQPAWTLPILYMHPEFDGELIKPLDEGITELPAMLPSLQEIPVPVALVRSLDENDKVWYIRGGLMRVGRRPENDLVIQERWVSQKHAEIISRDTLSGPDSQPAYFLRDFSRYGTLISSSQGWQKIHHQEVPLYSGVKLKFGSAYGQTLEFIIE